MCIPPSNTYSYAWNIGSFWEGSGIAIIGLERTLEEAQKHLPSLSAGLSRNNDYSRENISQLRVGKNISPTNNCPTRQGMLIQFQYISIFDCGDWNWERVTKKICFGNPTRYSLKCMHACMYTQKHHQHPWKNPTFSFFARRSIHSTVYTVISRRCIVSK